MNYGIIKYIVGWTLILEAALMVPSAIVALIYGEAAVWAFVETIGLCFLAGMALKLKKPGSQVFFTREGFVSVALSWVALSVMGGLPFVFSGAIKNPVDALFETVSGFTTTGASILSSVEKLYSLDRRYGGTGIFTDPDSHERRFPYEYYEGGKPGALCQPSGA